MLFLKFSSHSNIDNSYFLFLKTWIFESFKKELQFFYVSYNIYSVEKFTELKLQLLLIHLN